MNFLAHLSLSNNDDDLLIGNFIADSVRKKEWKNYKPEVVEGIKLHHKIDFFTDNHSTVEKSKERMRAKHGKYTPVIVDILYDHFLARNFTDYNPYELESFARRCYELFKRRSAELPSSVNRMVMYMERDNWLVGYAHKEGLERSLYGMSRRASFDNKMDEAVRDMYKDYANFENDFREFYPKLQDYVKGEINRIPW